MVLALLLIILGKLGCLPAYNFTVAISGIWLIHLSVLAWGISFNSQVSVNKTIGDAFENIFIALVLFFMFWLAAAHYEVPENTLLGFTSVLTVLAIITGWWTKNNCIRRPTGALKILEVIRWIWLFRILHRFVHFSFIYGNFMYSLFF